jgi:succinoglycan biosynthesis protein ExoL
MEAGFNSSWLLPNRLYEGGYFGVPSVAPAGTQTGQWITSHGAGFELKEDLAQTLPGLVRQLLKNPDVILTHRKRLLTLPQETFVARNGELADMVEKTLLELPSVTLSSPKKAKTPNPRFGHR